jgi:RimJ/RimL family protein N-acetyltransferase
MNDALDLTIRPVTEADIRDFATWRYEPPLDVYNITQTIEEAVEYFMRPSTGCHAILEGGDLAAFFTFGEDARVPGGDYSAPGLDIGLGVKPALIGHGAGRSYVEAVVGFAHETSDAGPLRVTIAAENRAALTVWSRSGFVETQRFRAAETVMGSNTFVVLESGSHSQT